ncbi:MAG: ferrous iron transport protein B [Bacteroidetes bacterium]|nr:ferrous iron transport protein B [Bacteroidota bacterium]
MKPSIKIALIGNPNTGKSSLFNALTGLNQKIANFPGITVEKTVGEISIAKDFKGEIIDMPGTYSLFPKSKDEAIPYEVLTNPHHAHYPNMVIFVADACNLRRNLVLLTQLIDLKFPVILALNMIDQAKAQGIEIDIPYLENALGIPVVTTNARKKIGIDALKKKIEEGIGVSAESFLDATKPVIVPLEVLKSQLHLCNSYQALLNVYQDTLNNNKLVDKKKILAELREHYNFDSGTWQREDLLFRYKKVNAILQNTLNVQVGSAFKRTQERLDKVLGHPFWGYIIFFGILFVIFQAIFSWAEYPMHKIEDLISWLQGITRTNLPKGVLNELLAEGVLPGLGGVLVFVPQIAFLFGFIAVMEDTGYLARVAFLMDKMMRRFGLNGKSVIPLISGTACAVPAIMSARSIEHKKSRLITILVTPLMSCSARLPVYILLIGLVIPNQEVLGVMNLRGLTLMGMYLLGFLAAIGAGFIYKLVLNIKEKQYFILEMPVYRMPNWRNVGTTMFQKSRTFVTEAGKVIVAISVILWFLASFSMPGRFAAVDKKYQKISVEGNISLDSLKGKIKAEKLEKSFAGIIGKSIEPAIAPLGFDWKIGIAIITSFAAREVFVGTMATIYGLGSDKPDFNQLKNQMLKDRNPETGAKIYSFATVFSLMVFYAFALQCMSTVAVTYKETASWKWTLLQFASMAVLAWVASFLVNHGLS